jgi:hypothetical protein
MRDKLNGIEKNKHIKSIFPLGEQVWKARSLAVRAIFTSVWNWSSLLVVQRVRGNILSFHKDNSGNSVYQ